MGVLENVTKLCKDKSISVAELERTVKLGNGVVGKWAVSSPRLENIEKVARFFNCTVDDLLKEENE